VTPLDWWLNPLALVALRLLLRGQESPFDMYPKSHASEEAAPLLFDSPHRRPTAK